MLLCSVLSADLVALTCTISHISMSFIEIDSCDHLDQEILRWVVRVTGVGEDSVQITLPFDQVVRLQRATWRNNLVLKQILLDLGTLRMSTAANFQDLLVTNGCKGAGSLTGAFTI